jgi:plastocyanin
MKKAVVGVIVAIVLIGGGVAAYYAYKGNPYASPSPSPSSSMSTMPMNSTSPSATPVTASSVTIQDFAFGPSAVTVKKGTTVTWTNKDSAAHTVTETDGKDGPKSGTLETGKSYSFTYNTVGTFSYHCSIHPSMTGTVTVTE